LSQNRSTQTQSSQPNPMHAGLSPAKYIRETTSVPLGTSIITLENLTPILSEKERAKRKREIETRLFDVFKKYA